MSRLLLTEPTNKKTMTHDQYLHSIYWLLRQRVGGGWPPRDVGKVSGWMVVRMLAHQSGRSPRDVAADLVEQSLKFDEV